VLFGVALLIAAAESCAQRKVEKAMSEDTRSWGELVGGCRLSIARLHSSIGAESEGVVLDIVFRNEGSTGVQFPRISLWFDYDFAVLTESGAEVPLTGFGKQQHENLGTAAATIMEVAPGGEYRSTVELSRLYEFDRPGSYSVQASKTFRDPNSHQFVTVMSNRLDLKVARPAGRL
jgi:hypothetical protein